MAADRGDSTVFRTVKYFTIMMNVLGMVILVLMMLLTVTDVFLRYFFNSPILGSTEITEYMMVCLALGVPYCALTDKAVRMDLLAQKLPKRFQAFADGFTDLVGLVAMAALSWQLFKETANAHEIGYSSSILNIPSSPFFGVLAFSMSMMCVSLIVNVARDIAKGVRR
jgi:TRAP-type C4-dicarboxylate transport system permease small subunit